MDQIYAAIKPIIRDYVQQVGSIIGVDADVQPGPIDLTEIEIKYLWCASFGLSNRQIGRQMDTTENTVKTVLQRVNMKLGAYDRAHAVRRAFERGLLTPHDVKPLEDGLPRSHRHDPDRERA
jgi:DNA-binding NarL/FixJ family response regulator